MTYTRTVSAYNTATASDNRIHDDATASRFGFTGGLVPGVDVFAYMAHAPMKLWGRDWLENGRMSARFDKPVYDGDEAILRTSEHGAGGMTLALWSRGSICAVGEAHRDGGAGAGPDIPGRGVQPDPEKRLAASPESLGVGLAMGYPLETYTAAEGREHLEMVREEAELYADGAIASPAWLLRRANYILATNVRLGPWIHVESDVRLHRVVRDGDVIDVRARVAGNHERKGHRIVDLDIAILADGDLAMSGRHVAIYEPRQVRQAL